MGSLKIKTIVFLKVECFVYFYSCFNEEKQNTLVDDAMEKIKQAMIISLLVKWVKVLAHRHIFFAHLLSYIDKMHSEIFLRKAITWR